MKKIIVPIDFSKYSEYALETAALIAKKNNSQILALHMLEISETLLTKSDHEEQEKVLFFVKLAEQKFKTFLDKAYLAGVAIIPIIKHYKVFSEINKVAQDQDVDLIIMGSHGTGQFSDYFVGSNTDKVVRNSNIPVLVIKSKPKSIEFKNVIFTSDFSEEAIKPFINACHLLANFGSNIQLLTVTVEGDQFKSSSQMEARMKEFLQTADGNLDRMSAVNYVSETSIKKGVLRFAKKINADLIIIPTHGRKGLFLFFEESISEDLVNHANLPVMTFKI